MNKYEHVRTELLLSKMQAQLNARLPEVSQAYYGSSEKVEKINVKELVTVSEALLNFVRAEREFLCYPRAETVCASESSEAE